MCSPASPLCLASPDGAVELSFGLAPAGPKWEHDRDCPFYRITYCGRTISEWSRLGLELGGAAEFNSGFEVVGVERDERESLWRPVYGERAEIQDRFRQMRVVLRETIPPQRTLWLEFRCYPEGAAFRYVIPEQEGIGAWLGSRSLFNINPSYLRILIVLMCMAMLIRYVFSMGWMSFS